MTRSEILGYLMQRCSSFFSAISGQSARLAQCNGEIRRAIAPSARPESSPRPGLRPSQSGKRNRLTRTNDWPVRHHPARAFARQPDFLYSRGRRSKWTSWSKGLHYRGDVLILFQVLSTRTDARRRLVRQGELELFENVEFIFLGQDFDFHTGKHTLPGTLQ